MINLYFSKTTTAQTKTLAKLLAKSEGLDSSDIVIAEDRFTMSLEREILSSKKGNGSFSVNVCSFGRLAKLINKNATPLKSLTKTGGVMLVSKILTEVKDYLSSFKNLASSYTSLSESLFEIIAQLKSSLITPDDLLSVEPSSKALKNKARDIGLIYKKYEEYKSGDYLDAQDKADLLTTLIPSSELIRRSNVYIVGFSAFTKQFYHVISKLFLTAKNVHVFVLDGENDVYESSVKDNLIDLLEALQTPYRSSALEDELSIEQKAINDYLFSFVPESRITKKQTDKVFISAADGFEEELERVAVDILKKVRIKNERFSSFTVVAPELESNVDVIKKTFSAYAIPAFLDSKVRLSEHAMTKVALSVLSMAGGDYDLDHLKNLLFSPYFELPYEQKEGFENYLLSVGRTRRTIKYPLKNAEYESVRLRLLEYIPSIKELTSPEIFAFKVKALLDKLSTKNELVFNRFTAADEREFAALTLQAKESFCEVLDELQTLTKGSLFTLEDFINILTDGLKSKELSLVPLYADSVFVGDFSSSKIGECDYLYVLSCNNGVVPMQKSDVGLLTDKDIDELGNSKVALEPKIELVNERERLNVFLGITNFKKELHLSYSTRSKDFKSINESEVISTIKSIFTKNGKNLCEEEQACSFENLDDYVLHALPTKEVLEKRLAVEHSELLKTGDAPLFAPLNEALRSSGQYRFDFDGEYENVKNAYDNKPIFSVTDLETYFDCPFKNFVSHSLYAKERDNAEVKANNAGTYIHDGLERLMARYDELSIDNYMDVATKITDELKVDARFAILTERPKYKTALRRLDNEFYSVAKELVERKPKVSFKPLGEEIRFGYDKSISFDGKTVKLPPYTLSSGERLRGSVDYADTFGGYLRVIDYKTGVIDDSFASVYNGHKFQPFIYLSALSNALNLQPAGALYFPISSKFQEVGKPPYQMKGHYLGQMDAVLGMDNTLAPGRSSSIISAALTNGGAFNGKVGANARLSSDELDRMLKYSDLIADNAISEMRKGFIKPIPFKRSCERCAYKGICGYDPNFEGERATGTIKKDVILKAVLDE